MSQTAATIAITGATGFLGGALAKRLLAEGHTIRALSRTTGHDDFPSGVEWITGDLADPASLSALVTGADRIIHAAGILGEFGIREEDYRQINAEGTRQVLAATTAALVDGRLGPEARVLHVGSAGILGPIRGRADGFRFDETMPFAPSNAYERSKALAESYAREFALAGLPVVIVRPEFVYGPGDRHVLGLFRAIERGMFFYVGSGNNHCHPTYIDDAVEGMVAGLQTGRVGQAYQIAGPRSVSFRELAETIAAALGVPPPRVRVPRAAAWLGAGVLEVAGRATGRSVPLSRTGVAFFSEDRRFSSAKAERELGYVPHVELKEGVARTIAWYRAEGLLGGT
ncbi:MAG: NAD-dependent epimerase/dehydratase family protein [Anaerolineae bacterium]|nr:NAD-dependent epimerase/dehydratase family protein [Promineifilum sp.]MCW5847935.1 NAD-dependent epimerase/dehydratase family protein [Anaerolineae bacterium]